MKEKLPKKMINIRLTEDEKKAILHAATAERRTITNFIVIACMERAKKK